MHPKRKFKKIETSPTLCEWPKGCNRTAEFVCQCCTWFCKEHSNQHIHTGEWEGIEVHLSPIRQAIKIPDSWFVQDHKEPL